jgi:hypothetical protein
MCVISHGDYPQRKGIGLGFHLNAMILVSNNCREGRNYKCLKYAGELVGALATHIVRNSQLIGWCKQSGLRPR